MPKVRAQVMVISTYQIDVEVSHFNHPPPIVLAEAKKQFPDHDDYQIVEWEFVEPLPLKRDEKND